MGYEMFENLCRSKGVTPYRVAKETGVSTSTLSSWKSGRYTPKLDKLKAIADYFGVDVSVFGDVHTNVPYDFYIDKQTIVIAQKIYDNPELRMLFEATDNVPPQDLKLVADMVKRLKRTNGDE